MLDVAEERLVAGWRGPIGHTASGVRERVCEALGNPCDFPALSLTVVPGDHVVVALGAQVPETGLILGELCRIMQSAGVDAGSITILAEPDAPDDFAGHVPSGVVLVKHDPENRDGLAYLATTTEGKRVYLNKLLIDADLVIPVGRIAYYPGFGYKGPWSVIYPDLSDTEARSGARLGLSEEDPHANEPTPAHEESTEVGWLLGCQFQVGVVAGISGMVEVIAGLGASVFEQGAKAIDAMWSIRADTRADLVVAGIGLPGEATKLEDVGRGLAAAMQLVQRGGKIAILSRAAGSIGPAIQRLMNLDDPRAASKALRGAESESDYGVARQFAKALGWADVYLLSALESETVEDLSMVPIDRPEEVRRLVAASASCIILSHADLARVKLADEESSG